MHALRRDTAALHKYPALVWPRPDHNGRSIQFCHYIPAETADRLQ